MSKVVETYTYKLYPSYKRSGIEWLGDMPSHWDCVRLKNTIHDTVNGVWGDEPTGEGDIACIRVGDFDRTKYRAIDSNITYRNIAPSQLKRRILNKGDLLIEKSGGGDRQPVGQVVSYDLDIPAVCSNFIAKITLTDGLNSRYLCYLFSVLYGLRINVRSIKQTTGIQNLDSEQYFNELVVLPPLEEQIQIVDFLHRKVEQIDEVIAEKGRLMALLQEQRETIVKETITKGMNSNDELVSCNLPWFTMLPKNWRLARIKDLISCSDYGISDSHQETGKFTVLTMGNVNNGKVTLQSDKKVEKVPPHLILENRDLLYNRTNSLDQICKVGIFSGNRLDNITFASYLVRFRANELVLPEYLNYALNCKPFLNYVRKLAKPSISQANLSPTEYIQNYIPCPSLEQQEKTTDYLNRVTDKIDGLITHLAQQIQFLVEYKSALITEAVTGKIDVREVDLN